MKNKNFIVNLVCQLIVFASNMIINFFLTPYVLEKLGTEAYGFIGLVNNFVSYITIVTIALNSMAGRYITLSYHKEKKKDAEEYYSSVFFANVALSIAVIVIMFVFIFNISAWLNIPMLLLKDVRITIIISCINTIISLIAVVYGVAAFIKNRLYLNSLTQMAAAIIRLGIIINAFIFFKAHMWYYSLAAAIASLITMILQIRVTSSLCPDLTINIEKLSWNKVLQIVKSGIWVSVESFNKILQTGLDLLISNLFVSINATGLLSIAKTIPSVLTQITSTIANVFNPELARLYAENNFEELKKEFLFTIRVLSFIMIVPLVGFIIFGREFYSLWLSNKSDAEIQLIQTLSVLTSLPLLVNAYVEGLYYANTLTNKIKGSVMISLIFSIASILTELFLLYSTTLNSLFIIAGTSSIFLIVRYIVVTPIYSAYVLKLPILTFYPSLIKAIIVSGIIGIMFFIIKQNLILNSWIKFIICCGICGLIGYIIVFILLLNHQEKAKLIHLIKVRLKNAKKRL